MIKEKIELVGGVEIAKDVQEKSKHPVLTDGVLAK